MKAIALLPLLCALAALGCTASQPRPFDARTCGRACIDMENACKASCLRVIDPSGSREGSRGTCERTCQTQRDTCDTDCLHGKAP